MTREMKYYSQNNTYSYRKKRSKPAYSSTGFFICVILPVVTSLLITIILFMGSTSFNTIVDALSYNEIANTDYDVSLKENDIYEESVLPQGMNYVSSLIDKVNTKFRYEFHSSESLEFTYDYTISSKFVMLNYEDTTKELQKIDEVIKQTVSKTEISNNLIIYEPVEIDFQKYAEMALNYKQDLRVAATGKLVVYMTVHVNASKNGIEEKIDNDTIIEEIEIPLTDAVTDINVISADVNKQDFLTSTSKFTITNVVGFVIVVLLFEVDLFLIFRLYKEYKKYKSRDLYTSIVNKILKDYDRVIVSGKLEIDEAKYSNIIYPDTFEQMVDASMNEGSPILFYNVLPGQKCFFVIIKDDTLYKYRITRWFVDQNGHA